MFKYQINCLTCVPLRLAVLTLLWFYSVGSSFAAHSTAIERSVDLNQDFEITGTILDNNGVPLPGATVLEKGTNNGVQSDFDGNFTLEVSSEDAVLVISFVGFDTQEIALNGQSTIEVTLEENAAALDEVVVVGYGTQERSDLTGAVETADLETFRKSPNTNIAQSLQGTVPGLSVGQVTSSGSTPSLNIRGSSTISGNSNVLIVLDGIQYNGSLESINPNDIESINVLKDVSSTAVYGAQAANGVILITTKSGGYTRGTRVSASSSYAIQEPTEDIRPMRREEYLNHMYDLLYEEAYLAPDYTQPNPNFNLEDYIDPSMLTEDGEIAPFDYDWFDEGTHKGYINENKVSVSGGSEAVRYLFSLGLTDQENFIRNDNFQRKSIRLNLETKARDWWKIGIQSFGSFVNKDGAEPSMDRLLRQSPLIQPYDENGNLVPFPFNTNTENPFVTYDVNDYERHDYFFANLYTEIDFPFLTGLSYRLNFGNNYRINKYYRASEYAAGFTGEAFKNHNNYYDWNLDNILTYKDKFGKHAINATLLYGAIKRQNEYTGSTANGFTRLSLGYNSLEQGTNQFAYSDAWQETLNYQMARVNYKFDDKYIFTGTIRRDGFSGFAQNNKYGYFPSAALAWVLSNESFLQNEKINNLKLRVGYGLSGNQTSRYNSIASLITRPAYIYGDGGSTAFGQEQNTLGNADLRWEKTTGLNLGVDFSLFSSRISGNVEYYINRTNDLLFQVAIPHVTGFNDINTNIGKLENKGFELGLNTHNIEAEDFSWTSTINFSTNKNKILELTGRDSDGDGVEDDLISSNLFIGESLGTIYAYQTKGIYQLNDEIPEGYFPGTLRVVDQNGDGNITPADDRVILGRSEPAYRIGFINNLSYKNWNLNVFINSIQGGKDGYLGYNLNRLVLDDNALRDNYPSGVNFWSPNNPAGDQPLSRNNATIEPGVWKDRSFIRLQDVNLSYSFEPNLIEKLSLSDLTLFISGKNIATWTDWKGWDPETNQELTRNGRPVMKSYSLGLNLTF
ncbi:TonB-dependent receptor [Zunongwangia sp. F363]|uniref:TonB-dependent receptor n=1 Tax=Autumnicola tepida TaxID=3075595 RepID=A0ABU3C8Y2_9FLAO|nr:TonB-dependent receptor [Zunongwangia sp. F363]MDT0642787.1 TonB-dependent receptor [Zunongwangia sp. F363]